MSWTAAWKSDDLLSTTLKQYKLGAKISVIPNLSTGSLTIRGEKKDIDALIKHLPANTLKNVA